MISKVKTGTISAINPCCNYSLQEKKGANILNIQGLRYSPNNMAKDFIINAGQKPSKTKNVLFHGILSFPKEEKINKNLVREIATKYLKHLGFENAPFAIIEHNDKDHYHLHCLSSFIDLEGKIVDDSWIGLRAKKIAQELTREFGLIPANKKNYNKTNFKNFKKDDKERYRLYSYIDNALKYSKSFPEFEKILNEKGIEIKYKYKSNSSVMIQGISFKSGDFCFKGSEIDRNFSYSKLNNHFENLVVKIVPLSSEPESNKSITADIFSGIFQGLHPSHHYSSPSSSRNPNDGDEEELRKKKKKKKSKSL